MKILLFLTIITISYAQDFLSSKEAKKEILSFLTIQDKPLNLKQENCELIIKSSKSHFSIHITDDNADDYYGIDLSFKYPEKVYINKSKKSLTLFTESYDGDEYHGSYKITESITIKKQRNSYIISASYQNDVLDEIYGDERIAHCEI